MQLLAPKLSFRAVLGLVALISNALFVVDTAHAGPQLNGVTKAVTACVAAGQPQPCPQGEAALQRWRQAPGYAKADRFCKEQTTEMGRVLALLRVQDVIDQTVQSSLDSLIQACAPFGL
ncbi:MAG: hypothetical protein RLZZ336_935 [Cyanobacteriota bacterium]